MKVKEESEKAGLKLNIQKTKIMPSGPITSWQVEGEKVEAVIDFIFLGSKITVDSYFVQWPSSVQLQHARLLCPAVSYNLLKFMSIESVMPSNHLILCRPLLLLPPIPPSIRVFSIEVMEIDVMILVF